jgi:tRNA pseudouridine55 synthase
MTSAKCVSQIKNILKQKNRLPSTMANLGLPKVGHMGTLDPMGCGVLLVGIGKATRLFEWFLEHDKVYIADFAFGFDTDTLDITGQTQNQTTNIPTLTQLKAVIPQMIGLVEQLPPNFSAKNINGKRAYDLARLGQTVNLTTCPVQIHSIDILEQLNPCTFRFKISCGSGTYIRSICRDIAAMSNSLATMTSLQRTQCGKFKIDKSVALEAVDCDSILPIDKCLPDFDKLNLKDKFFTQLKNGGKIYLDCDLERPNIVYCDDVLFGIGVTQNKRLVIKTNLLV